MAEQSSSDLDVESFVKVSKEINLGKFADFLREYKARSKEIHVLDIGKVYDLLREDTEGGDPKHGRTCRVFLNYYTDAKLRTTQMKAALQRHDFSEVSREANDECTAAMFFGMKKVVDMCRSIRLLVREGRYDQEAHTLIINAIDDAHEDSLRLFLELLDHELKPRRTPQSFM